eukprot:8394060-Ditylum_brightwellii.AAC.1
MSLEVYNGIPSICSCSMWCNTADAARILLRIEMSLEQYVNTYKSTPPFQAEIWPIRKKKSEI